MGEQIMQQFSGKSVLVTGAASGIGRATMERLARSGARVLACDINEAGLRDAAAALVAEGREVITRPLDVTDEQACRDAVADCVRQFGGLDVLCNIAGMVKTCHFHELTSEDWRRVMDVNANSVFVLCHAALPHLLKSGGNIVNISSTAGLTGLPYNSAYCASKGAVLQLSRALAVEYAGRGVRVNAICPGAVDTPLVKDLEIPEGDRKSTRLNSSHVAISYAVFCLKKKKKKKTSDVNSYKQEGFGKLESHI